jgi:hypothetical protein
MKIQEFVESSYTELTDRILYRNRGDQGPIFRHIYCLCIFQVDHIADKYAGLAFWSRGTYEREENWKVKKKGIRRRTCYRTTFGLEPVLRRFQQEELETILQDSHKLALFNWCKFVSLVGLQVTQVCFHPRQADFIRFGCSVDPYVIVTE